MKYVKKKPLYIYIERERERNLILFLHQLIDVEHQVPIHALSLFVFSRKNIYHYIIFYYLCVSFFLPFNWTSNFVFTVILRASVPNQCKDIWYCCIFLLSYNSFAFMLN